MTAATGKRFGFAFAPRFFLLWSLGWLLLVLVARHATWGWLLPAWSVLLLLVWLADCLRLPAPARLTASRTWPERLEIGAAACVTLTLANHSRHSLWIQATDAIPPALSGREDFAATTARLDLAPGTSTDRAFHLFPWQRGRHAAGDVHLRYRGAWGLAERWARVPQSEEVIVFPNLDDARRDAMVLTRTQQIALERRLARRTGQGREFHHLREYREGDEFRDVYWPASARRGHIITQVRRQERSQTVWLVLDCGRLLRTRVAPPADLPKDAPPMPRRLGRAQLDCAVSAALSLAVTALHLGDSVGLLAYGAALQRLLPASAGPAQLRPLVSDLAALHAEPVEAGHARAAARLLALQKRRALVLWLTEMTETTLTPEVVEAATHLTARHLVLFVTLRPGDDAAPSPELYAAAADIQIRMRREAQLARLRRQGAMTLEIPAPALAPALVSRYLEVKQTARL